MLSPVSILDTSLYSAAGGSDVGGSDVGGSDVGGSDVGGNDVGGMGDVFVLFTWLIW